MASIARNNLRCSACAGRILRGSPVAFKAGNPPRPFHPDCLAPGETTIPEPTHSIDPTPTIVAPEPTPAPVVAPAAPGSIDAIIDARIEARVGSMDPAGLDARIASAVAAVAPRTVTIKVERVDAPPVELAGEHKDMPRLLRVFMAGLIPYLWGEPGTGKTTALIRALKALGKEVELETLDPSTPKSGILGYRTPDGAPVHTATSRSVINGGGLVLDEADNTSGTVQNMYNTILANGTAAFAWGTVLKHVGFMLGAAGNSPGRPTPQFPERKLMGAAFKDRLYFMHWALDPNIERRATGRREVTHPARIEATCTPAQWGEWVERMRKWAAAGNAPTMLVTPRATLDGLKALAAGETPLEMAHGLVFRGADEDLVAKALAAVPLPE